MLNRNKYKRLTVMQDDLKAFQKRVLIGNILVITGYMIFIFATAFLISSACSS